MQGAATMAIHVVQANPAMDRIEVVGNLDVGGVNRSSQTHVVAGGKGLNVARALRRLGHRVGAYGFLGGAVGAFIRQACTQLDIVDRHVSIDEETRVCMIVVDRSTRLSTVINEPGPMIDRQDEDRLTRSVVTRCRPGDVVVMAGSLAVGMGADFYARLVSDVQAIGARAVVDTSGEALEAALKSAPWMVKANVHELQEVGVRVDEWTTHLGAETEWMVATSGGDGAIARSRLGTWRATVPQVHVDNATGAGDIFLAALLSRISHGDPMVRALPFAAAAAAGSVISIRPELPDEATLTPILESDEGRGSLG